MTAVDIDALGYGPLIPIVPPDGKIATYSKLKAASAGKVPGLLTKDGWVGIDWRNRQFTPAAIDEMRGNIGLLCGKFVALDLDVRDVSLSRVIREIVCRHLKGKLALRVGEAPKCAFLLRASEKMGRRQLHFNGPDGRHHIVELLADGQQIVVAGVHPRTMRPYHYPHGLPPAAEIDEVDVAAVDAIFDEIAATLDDLGIEVSQSGSGPLVKRDEVDQQWLTGPTERILEAVAHIPNTAETHPTYVEYIEMAIAIKAATINDPEAGLQIFLGWALLWAENTVESATRDWEGIKPPLTIGADYLYTRARQYGFPDAPYEFDALEGPAPAGPGCKVEYSDIWLRDRLVDAHGNVLRYVRAQGLWYAYENGLWVASKTAVRPFAIQLCADVAEKVYENGIADDLKGSGDVARRLASNRTVNAVAQLAEDAGRLQALVDLFDSHPDYLGVPGGVVDLRTGCLLPPERERFISRRTRVAPAPGPAPLWEKFLWDACDGDQDMIFYLQRVAGYCLTGRTEEHVFFFFWGGGGTGKSTFLGTLASILGEYCATASPDTFISASQREHPAGIAALVGARMVQSQETRPGQGWDEMLLKSLTGGDQVTARFMYGNPFTYTPLFKLLFSGNHQPKLVAVGEAMRRRLHVVPFVHKPPVANKQLGEQLREEYPQILAWMIEGARAWASMGLAAPAGVTAATEEYMESEDTLGRWITDCCEERDDAVETSAGLYTSWTQWCAGQGIQEGSQITFGKRLRERGLRARRSNGCSRWEGLKLREEKNEKGKNGETNT